MRVSDTRQGILEFIHNFVEQRGYAPTMGEIRRTLGINSKSLVEYHLKVLEREGGIVFSRCIVEGYPFYSQSLTGCKA